MLHLHLLSSQKLGSVASCRGTVMAVNRFMSNGFHFFGRYILHLGRMVHLVLLLLLLTRFRVVMRRDLIHHLLLMRRHQLLRNNGLESLLN